MIKGEWAGLLTIATSTEVQNKGGGVLRLRNCQAIIDLIKAKRHRWLPYSAAVLHKVGRVKVTQEGGACLGCHWQCTLALARTNTNTHTDKHSHMFAAKVKGCRTTKAAAALVAQAAFHIPRILVSSLWRYVHQLEQLNYRTIKINQSICKISVTKNITMKTFPKHFSHKFVFIFDLQFLNLSRPIKSEPEWMNEWVSIVSQLDKCWPPIVFCIFAFLFICNQVSFKFSLHDFHEITMGNTERKYAYSL